VAWWFLFVGVFLMGLGITQAVVGTDRIVGRRFTFDDFTIGGRPIEPRHVVLFLATAEIAAGLVALAVGVSRA
jgi:hypothetical protein